METIKLDDFIGETLADIAKGIQKANQAFEEGKGPYWELHQTVGGSTKKPIEFDIALAATKDTAKGGGISVALASIGGGGKLETTVAHEQYHRIKFSIGLEGGWTGR